MKKTIVASCALLGAFLAFADAGTELVQTTDLARKNTAISWQFTECCDTAVRLSVKRNGEDFDVSGWDTSLVLGGTSSGCVVEGVATGYGTILFTIPACSMPTNGKYTVQITAMKDRRSEEWARGVVRVNLNPGMGYMPTCWMGYQKVAKLAASMITHQYLTNDIIVALTKDFNMTVIIPASTNPCVRVLKSFVDEIPVKTKFVYDGAHADPMEFRNAEFPDTYISIPSNRNFMASTFYLSGANGVERFNPERIGHDVWYRSTSVTNRKFMVRGGYCTDRKRNTYLIGE